MNKYVIIGLGSFLLSLPFFINHITRSDQEQPALEKSKKINLAIRQAAHNLYMTMGDSTSTIPPINEDVHHFSLRLDQKINYDTLPYLLEDALIHFKILDEYFVSLTDCASDSIQLGYGSSAFRQNQLPCAGRENTKDCFDLTVSFYPKEKAEFPYLPIGILLFGIGLVTLLYSRRIINPTEVENADSLVSNNHNISIGSSQFDPKNLIYTYNSSEKVLTFRESKLLTYFIHNKNEILKREDIQSHVWEDEGVIVGRSLDVFISRLRKIIKEDKHLAITNIHGVGYKLEEKK